MKRECATRLCHLHQAEHALIQTCAAGSGDDHDSGAIGGAVFDRAGDAFAHDRAHGGGEKAEIHHSKRDFVTLDQSMTADDGIGESSAVLIFAQPVFVGSHAAEFQRIDRNEIGIHFCKAFRIAEILDSFFRGLGKMIIASRTNALILRQLDLMHDLGTAGAFLPQALWHLAFFSALSFQSRLLENRHRYPRAAVAAYTETAPACFRTQAHSLKVEPVVRTSSIKSTCKSCMTKPRRKRKAPLRFSMRSKRSNCVCVVV